MLDGQRVAFALVLEDGLLLIHGVGHAACLLVDDAAPAEKDVGAFGLAEEWAFRGRRLAVWWLVSWGKGIEYGGGNDCLLDTKGNSARSESSMGRNALVGHAFTPNAHSPH